MNAVSNDAFTVCGTLEYMAPEVLNKTGHGKAVDWWCLGVLIYEMIAGSPPFFTQDKADLINQIKTNTPKFPKMKKDIKDLIIGLLRKNPQERLGSKNGALELKAHPWFSDINWNQLLDRKVVPPYVPNVESQTDVSNFAEEFTQAPIDSSKQQSVQSDEVKAFSDFSFDKSQQDRMDIEEYMYESADIKMVIKAHDI